jgi:hypothetical protein
LPSSTVIIQIPVSVRAESSIIYSDTEEKLIWMMNNSNCICFNLSKFWFGFKSEWGKRTALRETTLSKRNWGTVSRPWKSHSNFSRSDTLDVHHFAKSSTLWFVYMI